MFKSAQLGSRVEDPSLDSIYDESNVDVAALRNARLPREFTPRWDAFQLARGVYIPNEFIFGQTHPDSFLEAVNPYSWYQKKYGARARQAIWTDSYTTPHKRGEPNFEMLISANCTGSAVMAAMLYDNRRMHGKPPMAALTANMAKIWRAAVRAQCAVLTDDILLHYKYFSMRPAEYLSWIEQNTGGNYPTALLTFIPRWGLWMLPRIKQCHTVVLKGHKKHANGTVSLHVWDPNLPADGERTIEALGEKFLYTGRGMEGEIVFTNSDGGDPPFYPGMVMAPIPYQLFLGGKKPFFNGCSVIFG